VTGDKVRLGIEAPADMVVLREELEPHPRADIPRPNLSIPTVIPSADSLSQ